MNKKDYPERYIYPAIFTYENGKEIAVEFPDLKVATSGIDEKDALFSAQELLKITMLGIEIDRENIPTPTPLREVCLDENESATLVDVYMPPFRAKQKEKITYHTVEIPNWMDISASHQKINYSKVLQNALAERLEQ